MRMYKLVVMVVTMLLVLGVVVNGCVHSAVAGAGSLPQFSCCQPLQPEPRQQGKWRGGDTSTGWPGCLVLEQGAVNQLFLGVFLIFLACLDHARWAKFHLGILKP